MSELGFNNFDVLNYFGLVAPSGTPQPVIDKLNAAIAKAVQLPDVRARFNSDALESAAGTPAQMASFIDADYQAWQKVVAVQKLKIDAA